MPICTPIGGTVRKYGADALMVGGLADHVHILAALRGNHCTADLIRETKKASTAWMSAPARRPDFTWQEGYGAFSVSKSDVGRVIAYIANQEEHHRHISSAEELAKLLQEHDVQYSRDHFQ